jgi:hypothetical protein
MVERERDGAFTGVTSKNAPLGAPSTRYAVKGQRGPSRTGRFAANTNSRTAMDPMLPCSEVAALPVKPLWLDLIFVVIDVIKLWLTYSGQ